MILYISFTHQGTKLEIIKAKKKECATLNLNLRHAVISNVSGNSQDQLQDTIVDAIQSGEEKMLPGLGVLFEVIWQNANNEDKKEMLTMLEQGLNKNVQ